MLFCAHSGFFSCFINLLCYHRPSNITYRIGVKIKKHFGFFTNFDTKVTERNALNYLIDLISDETITWWMLLEIKPKKPQKAP